ncbi:MAG TPA: chromate transporter [Bryobacteraceae bacterium]|jgi:chromate transporter|nr:chromate transporter [Bryobacteraceae bacterium]
MPRPRLTSLSRLFARVGVTVFGGGDPTIAILQREFYQREWLSPEKFAIAFGLARLTPGTNVLAFCAAAGWYIRGLPGALAAVLAITIPASVLVVWLTRAYDLTTRYPLALSIANALVAAAVGTMVGAAVLLVRSQLKRGRWIRPIVISTGAFLLAYVIKLSPLQVISVAAVAGFFWPES